MKLNKTKKEFDPNTHWYNLLGIIFIIFLIITAYSVYNFFYIEKEIDHLKIEAQTQILNSTSTDFIEKTKKNKQLTKDINNLKSNLDRFGEKEAEFNRLLNVKTISVATTTVATSSKQ